MVAVALGGKEVPDRRPSGQTLDTSGAESRQEAQPRVSDWADRYLDTFEALFDGYAIKFGR